MARVLREASVWFRNRSSSADWISTLAAIGNWRPAVAISPAGKPKCLSRVLRSRPPVPFSFIIGSSEAATKPHFRKIPKTPEAVQ